MLRIIETIISGFRASRERKQTLAELRSLDERTLLDIGLHQWQVPLLAAGMPLSERHGVKDKPVALFRENGGVQL
jgi:uncharacterized protein YjiS (DUF1127 family)